MNDERELHAGSKLYLRGKSGSLLLARCIVVVIIQAAFADGDCSAFNALLDEGDVSPSVEFRGVVRVHPRGRKNETRLGLRYSRGGGRRGERLADADDSLSTSGAGPGDYLVAVAVEGRFREVGVAVDEDDLPSVLRGHFRSIHRRMGAAT